MIVVVIIGILASIAYPIYTNQVMRAERADGRAAIMSTAQMMERGYTANNEYQDPGDQTSEQGLWIVDVETDGQTFTLTATKDENKGVTDTQCGTLTLDETGERGPTSDCW